LTLKLRPPRKSIPTSFDAKTVAILPKECSPELRKKSRTKKIKKTFEHDISPHCRGPLLGRLLYFLRVGWHPRLNHAYQILSRSRGGLRSYGGPKSGFSYSFLNHSYNGVTHYRATL